MFKMFHLSISSTKERITEFYSIYTFKSSWNEKKRKKKKQNNNPDYLKIGLLVESTRIT